MLNARTTEMANTLKSYEEKIKATERERLSLKADLEFKLLTAQKAIAHLNEEVKKELEENHESQKAELLAQKESAIAAKQKSFEKERSELYLAQKSLDEKYRELKENLVASYNQHLKDMEESFNMSNDKLQKDLIQLNAKINEDEKPFEDALLAKAYEDVDTSKETIEKMDQDFESEKAKISEKTKHALSLMSAESHTLNKKILLAENEINRLKNLYRQKSDAYNVSTKELYDAYQNKLDNYALDDQEIKKLVKDKEAEMHASDHGFMSLFRRKK